jgi:hypothetical protein
VAPLGDEFWTVTGNRALGSRAQPPDCVRISDVRRVSQRVNLQQPCVEWTPIIVAKNARRKTSATSSVLRLVALSSKLHVVSCLGLGHTSPQIQLYSPGSSNILPWRMALRSTLAPAMPSRRSMPSDNRLSMAFLGNSSSLVGAGRWRLEAGRYVLDATGHSEPWCVWLHLSIRTLYKVGRGPICHVSRSLMPSNLHLFQDDGAPPFENRVSPSTL